MQQQAFIGLSLSERHLRGSQTVRCATQHTPQTTRSLPAKCYCGSAGSYSKLPSEMAGQLQTAKVKAL